MKLLVLSLLFCAAVALRRADPAEDPPQNKLSDGGDVGELDMTEPESVDETELSEAEDGDAGETAEDPNSGETDPDSGEKVKRHWYWHWHRLRPRTWYTYGGRHYIYFPYSYHWAHAQRVCQAYGGTLATVHNVYVNRFLKRLTHRRPAWIGLSDAQIKGYWLWINGESWVYQNWCRGEPNNLFGNQACALINWTWRKCWDDQSCHTGRPFVCERK